ncbi:uncharacterized protein V1510DRAFT_404212 [Dipodascopsis tothii]|uniref:uncharacterized protein n=1 Tax=Dipodascopsis tothii TaxID=44089 RepID=UPI0034CEE021
MALFRQNSPDPLELLPMSPSKTMFRQLATPLIRRTGPLFTAAAPAPGPETPPSPLAKPAVPAAIPAPVVPLQERTNRPAESPNWSFNLTVSSPGGVIPTITAKAAPEPAAENAPLAPAAATPAVRPPSPVATPLTATASPRRRRASPRKARNWLLDPPSRSPRSKRRLLSVPAARPRSPARSPVRSPVRPRAPRPAARAATLPPPPPPTAAAPPPVSRPAARAATAPTDGDLFAPTAPAAAYPNPNPDAVWSRAHWILLAHLHPRPNHMAPSTQSETPLSRQQVLSNLRKPPSYIQAAFPAVSSHELSKRILALDRVRYRRG